MGGIKAPPSPPPYFSMGHDAPCPPKFLPLMISARGSGWSLYTSLYQTMCLLLRERSLHKGYLTGHLFVYFRLLTYITGVDTKMEVDEEKNTDMSDDAEDSSDSSDADTSDQSDAEEDVADEEETKKRIEQLQKTVKQLFPFIAHLYEH